MAFGVAGYLLPLLFLVWGLLLFSPHRAATASRVLWSAAILAAFADVNLAQDQLAAEISETDNWLKKQKGYGIFGSGTSFRRMVAATLVLHDHQADTYTAHINAGSTIAQVVTEELVFTIVMIICIASVNAANSANAANTASASS